jgi:hypothetical protein
MKENKILSGINARKNSCGKYSESKFIHDYIMGGCIMENTHCICMGKKIDPFIFVNLL